MGVRKTTEQVIKEFKKVHGGKYDYSKVDYKNNSTKVTIICPKHGNFRQTPAGHRKGGCFQCGHEVTASKRTVTNKKIIAEFIKVQGSRYDYSKVDYVNSKTPVKIICKIHGPFKQAPMRHKKGSHCPKCAGQHSPSTYEIIESFQKVHGGEYDYSLVEYCGAHKPVKIICKIHGEFEQSPSHDKLKSNPEDWYYYHTLYSEKRKEWDEIPYVEIGKMITRPEFIVADLGCGENLLT